MKRFTEEDYDELTRRTRLTFLCLFLDFVMLALWLGGEIDPEPAFIGFMIMIGITIATLIYANKMFRLIK